MIREVVRHANAKINLTLDVTGKRPDGYHLVEMVMQSVELGDTVRIQKTPGTGICLKMKGCDLPEDQDNIAYRAAQALKIADVTIEIEKHIPIAAGMAGGSTDAAAVLLGCNELFELGYSSEELCDLGLKLGADVPFCILGGTMLAEGIGEKLTKLPPFTLPDGAVILLARPEAPVSTREVYQKLDAVCPKDHPDTAGMVQALREGDYTGVAARLQNVLEEVTIPMHPVIGRIKEIMKQCGADGALMSGSGPTVFGLFSSEEAARAALTRIREEHLTDTVLLTRPAGR
ncbi:MAG: 4-(cytidine 5'-diphospho)-2-C-methyl-D-erythritol kinase [Lachnospiraceae bacterium]|nr:4-(cytidine 5'-diphospho)-2-C-methyl-D-erythritol kinase [Lachnospiraceae bacterium]